MIIRVAKFSKNNTLSATQASREEFFPGTKIFSCFELILYNEKMEVVLAEYQLLEIQVLLNSERDFKR